MLRIYDAEFSYTGNSHHRHIGKFWYENDVTGTKGNTWSRDEAVKYVKTNPSTVYVKEGTSSIDVRANSDSQAEWIQTYADGIYKDNLLALAKRHAEGKSNI